MLRSSLRHVPHASKLSVRRRRASSSQARQDLERGHWLPAAIVPKHELVQTDLKLGLADAVIRANQPLLQVANGAIHKGDHGRGAATQLTSRWLLARYVPDV